MLSSGKGEDLPFHSCRAEIADTDGAAYRIPILERVELPESWIPADSRVEIDAKINAGMDQCLIFPFGTFLTELIPQDISRLATA
jgi:hypothetical protein